VLVMMPILMSCNGIVRSVAKKLGEDVLEKKLKSFVEGKKMHL